MHGETQGNGVGNLGINKLLFDQNSSPNHLNTQGLYFSN